MENIIKIIHFIRNKKGFSYENMAIELNLSTSAYRKIETGETKLTLERLIQISKILETPLHNFLESYLTDLDINVSNDFEKKDAYGVYKKLVLLQEKRIEELEKRLEEINNKKS